MRAVRLWLFSVCVLIVAMVGVGGATRLTGSGLSIVEWKPISGVLPPLSQEAWDREFQAYQRFPEYQLKNQGMSLDEFKGIFYWEYFHRLLGRLIGLVYFLPAVYFAWRGRFRGRPGLPAKVAVGFLLGGLQGALGWYMVKSGLSLDPHVSHFRLAAHLLLALGLLVFLAWMAWDLKEESPRAGEKAPQGLRKAAWAFLALLCLQITYGAFVAGLKAGFAFNTFPKMGDFWVPPGLLSALEPWASNLISNPATVQFIHRCLAWALLAFGLGMAWFWGWGARGALMGRLLKQALGAVALFLLLQFSLGVATILLAVPVWLGVVHQLGAAFLLLAGARLVFLAEKA